MGIFDFIFGKTIKIEDPFFGKMIFSDFKKNPDKNYFECSRHFKPTDDLIEIGIEGNETGPTAIQKDFFRSIEARYNEVIASVKPCIESEFKNWKEDFNIADFRKEFKAVYLFLPRCEKVPIVWEIAFETEHDLNHTITITMADLNATSIHIDG